MALSFARQDRLHPVKHIAGDEGRMRPLIASIPPPKRAGVGQILEHPMQLGFRQGSVAATPVCEPDRSGAVPQRHQPSEYPPDAYSSKIWATSGPLSFRPANTQPSH